MTENKLPDDTLTAAKTILAREILRSVRDGDGLPVEADDALNNASRTVVAAMQEARGEAWLGRINLHGEQRGQASAALWRWDGSLVYNFGADFVVPNYDEELVRLILDRDRGPYTSVSADVPKVDAIMKRIAALGGVPLSWS